jgi:hypothetical protein
MLSLNTGDSFVTFSDDVQKGLIAGAFGLAGTLIPAIVSWSHDRDAASARLRKLDEATKKVAFWEQWLKLSTQICDPGNRDSIDRVQKELALLAEILESDSRVAQAEMLKQHGKSTAFQKKVQIMPFWRRFLLLYKPARSLAWFPRLFFFIGLFFAIILLFTLFDPAKEFSLRDLSIVEFMLFIWMAIFRSLSQWFEQPRGSSSLIESTSTVPPSPASN